MKQVCVVAVAFALLLNVAASWAADPFTVTVGWDENSRAAVKVDVKMVEGAYLYAERFHVRGENGLEIAAGELPAAKKKKDPFTDETVLVYAHDFSAVFPVRAAGADPAVTVEYQGCNADTCFLPQRETLELEVGTEQAEPQDVQPVVRVATDWRAAAERFTVVDTVSGYMKADRFTAFLQRAIRGGQAAGATTLDQRSLPLAVLLILLGGLALNLTPCVLPMLPINLAIIGAGSQAGSRSRGFALGGVYGLGIALAYGVLGAVVVLTGATFGSLNASPWFNGGIAVVFVLLALGMFDVLHVDLSRFQKSGVKNGGRFWTAFSMGVVAALLAGACVAPVVISVLLWASRLYVGGAVWGLLLPFVLGLGMALPWPFAGAGLSFLPKPGGWMIWVRNGFGVFILLLAGYYGYLAYELSGANLNRGPKGVPTAGAPAENSQLARELQAAADADQPVLLDFGASWCKNCQAMQQFVLSDAAVQQALTDVRYVHYDAEQPNDPVTKEVLEFYKVVGLPTYLVLKPVD